MANSTFYNIACFESYWGIGWGRNTKYAKHLVDLTANINSLDTSYYFSKNRADFEEALKNFKKKASFYGIVYIASHGEAGKILIGTDSISLSELADLFGKSLKDKFVHFGSCSTAKDKIAIREFIKKTKCKAVSGYLIDVDWLESAAIDILLFQELQGYKNITPFYKKFSKKYKSLVNKIFEIEIR